MALDKSANGHVNGYVVTTKPKRAIQTRARQGRVGWLTKQITRCVAAPFDRYHARLHFTNHRYRILVWYSIATILLRCPANESLITESSPKICKPYLRVRSFVAPHLTPYYDAYAAPYVQKVQPYYDIADKKVITPAVTYGKTYGAPRLAKAQKYGQAQWDKAIHPELLKFNKLAQDQYLKTVGPYANKAGSAISPYYNIARDNAIKIYHSSILPAYTTVQPHAISAYKVASNFALHTGYPYAKWIGTTAVVFVDRTIWPKIRILYGENVEPQLVRIGQRLGRYRDGKRLKAAIEEFKP